MANNLTDVKFVAISRLTDRKTILAMNPHTDKDQYNSEFKREVSSLVQQITPNQGTWYSQVHTEPAQIVFSILMDGSCDASGSNSLLRQIVGAIQGEARRQRLNLLEEDSIQHLDRICVDTLSKWAQPGSDKVNRAFEKIEQVKGQMQQNLQQIVNNQAEVADMETKSQNIQRSAFEIRQDARKLELEARRRRCRLMMIMGGSLLIVVFIIAFLFFSD